jgi:hypothetical protein
VATSVLTVGTGVATALGGVHGTTWDLFLSAFFVFGAVPSAIGTLWGSRVIVHDHDVVLRYTAHSRRLPIEDVALFEVADEHRGLRGISLLRLVTSAGTTIDTGLVTSQSESNRLRLEKVRDALNLRLQIDPNSAVMRNAALLSPPIFVDFRDRTPDGLVRLHQLETKEQLSEYRIEPAEGRDLVLYNDSQGLETFGEDRISVGTLVIDLPSGEWMVRNVRPNIPLSDLDGASQALYRTYRPPEPRRSATPDSRAGSKGPPLPRRSLRP